MALTPDQTIAQDAFTAYKKANYPNLTAADAFERFAVHEVALRQYNLSAAQTENGIVAGSNDGGIDGFFVFLNGQELVEADSVRISRRKNALDGLQAGLAIDIVIVQAKTATHWDTNALPKIESALKAILASNVNAEDLRSFPLNDDVVEKALALHALRQKLSMLIPVINFSVQYVTNAEQATVNAYMETKRRQLRSTLRGLLPSGSGIKAEYVGDAEVVKKLRASRDFSAKLVFAKPPVRLGLALVGLVAIDNYLKFLRKEGGKVLREELFAANVRDFAGTGIGVNGAISETLAVDSSTDFWWLNNGITVIADSANDPIELEWIIANPLIVNGLQTSNMIHEASLANRITKARLKETVLVRLIRESNPQVRESIIAGTNNQTAVASIQLHANEEKQLRIEEYLRHANWYYERRRYQYRGTTTPTGRIRTVTELAQAVIAYKLLEPDTARARPSSLLNNKRGWNRVFDDADSEELYLKALTVAAAVDAYLRTPSAKKMSGDATNARHYLVSGYALHASGVKSISDFDTIPTNELKAQPTDEILASLLKILIKEASDLDDGKIAVDKIYKGAALKAAYFEEIVKLNVK